MFIKRDKKDDCLIAGMAVGDIKEKEYNFKPFYEVAISIGKDEKGNDLPIVNVSIWGRKLDIKKYDKIFACGKLKINQKEDKTYYSLTADFIMKEQTTKYESVPPELTPVDDDSLPF